MQLSPFPASYDPFIGAPVTYGGLGGCYSTGLGAALGGGFGGGNYIANTIVEVDVTNLVTAGLQAFAPGVNVYDKTTSGYLGVIMDYPNMNGRVHVQLAQNWATCGSLYPQQYIAPQVAYTQPVSMNNEAIENHIKSLAEQQRWQEILKIKECIQGFLKGIMDSFGFPLPKDELEHDMDGGVQEELEFLIEDHEKPQIVHRVTIAQEDGKFIMRYITLDPTSDKVDFDTYLKMPSDKPNFLNRLKKKRLTFPSFLA